MISINFIQCEFIFLFLFASVWNVAPSDIAAISSWTQSVFNPRSSRLKSAGGSFKATIKVFKY